MSVSQCLAQQLRQCLPAIKPEVIPDSITLPSAQASLSDQPFRVVFSFRTLEFQKWIHQLVHTSIRATQASSQTEDHLIG